MMYPVNHKEIVADLREGKFITVDDLLFEVVHRKEDFYVSFFAESFGYELIGNRDFYYLLSEETSESTSRDIAIFFAVLCYELDKNGRNFLEELLYSEFHVDEILECFRDSSWAEVIKANKQLNTEDNIKRLVGTTMVKRNIAVKHSNESYSFTKAHRLFIDFAKDLVRKIDSEEQ